MLDYLEGSEDVKPLSFPRLSLTDFLVWLRQSIDYKPHILKLIVFDLAQIWQPPAGILSSAIKLVEWVQI